MKTEDEGNHPCTHLTHIIRDLNSLCRRPWQVDNHVESSTFLCITAALRLETIRKECSNSKGTWGMTL